MNINMTRTDTSSRTPPAATPDPKAHLTNKVNPNDLASKWRRTKCLVCNYVYEGTKTITVCPKCGNSDPDKFQEADQKLWTSPIPSEGEAFSLSFEEGQGEVYSLSFGEGQGEVYMPGAGIEPALPKTETRF